jgi:hypothetical protein
VVRSTTDEGMTGWGQIETPKPYLQPIVLQLRDWIVGERPLPWAKPAPARNRRTCPPLPASANGDGARGA